MAEILQIHPQNPQPRLIDEVVAVLSNGGVIAYPTDSAYALGCRIGEKNAIERIQTLRQLNKQHNFTLVCHDLSELGSYARVNNQVFRWLKAYTPGAYTFILPASHEVPRRLQHPKRKTIGIRVPDHLIVKRILERLNEPLMSVTLILPGEELPLSDPQQINDALGSRIDLIIGAGYCGVEPTTIIDLVGQTPVVLREGKGDAKPFQS